MIDNFRELNTRKLNIFMTFLFSDPTRPPRLGIETNVTCQREASHSINVNEYALQAGRHRDQH